MTSIAVAGCSFSDRTKVPFAYGDYLAEKLNYNYIHVARGSSSNHRSFYKLTKLIMDEVLLRGDIIILQYTEQQRKIFGSLPVNIPGRIWRPEKPGQVEIHKTPFGEAYTSDWKTYSHTWQIVEQNIILHQAYEECGAVNDEFEKDHLTALNTMFSALCLQRGIILVPLICRFMTHWERMTGLSFKKFLPTEISNHCFIEEQYLRKNEDSEIVEGRKSWPIWELGFNEGKSKDYDNAHLNPTGHHHLANMLYNHLKKHNFID